MILLLFPIIILVLMVVLIIGYWKAFEKAGQPGWAVIVPIYNLIVMFKIGGRNDWWAVLIPIYNIIVMWQLSKAIALKFGKTEGFGIGLFLMAGIFWPILGYGDAVYSGIERTESDELLDA